MYRILRRMIVLPGRAFGFGACWLERVLLRGRSALCTLSLSVATVPLLLASATSPRTRDDDPIIPKPTVSSSIPISFSALPNSILFCNFRRSVWAYASFCFRALVMIISKDHPKTCASPLTACLLASSYLSPEGWAMLWISYWAAAPPSFQPSSADLPSTVVHSSRLASLCPHQSARP